MELHGMSDFKSCDSKIKVLAGSLDKLFEKNIMSSLKEAEDLIKDALAVGVNVSYPESLRLKADDAFKKKNYKEAYSFSKEAEKWLNKILNDIENEE